MTTYGMGQAAELLGVSTDTVRRWVDAGKLDSTRSGGGRRQIEGTALARFARTMPPPPQAGPVLSESARNRFAGIVTRVVKDKVMAHVELQSGPHRVVSLMSREAADELGLAPGVWAVAAVKATNVIIELPAQP
jgi:molybdopterin-binding protein